MPLQWNPSCEATPFAPEKWPFKGGGWRLIRGRNQYIYVKINIVEWPFQRGWPLVRVASQKGFHCTDIHTDQSPHDDYQIAEQNLLKACQSRASKTKARRRPSDAIKLNWTVQSRLLVCRGLQLVRDDHELFLTRFKFWIAVQLRLLVCTVLQLTRVAIRCS